jgi:RND family efflux transporter MFP subunit
MMNLIVRTCAVALGFVFFAPAGAGDLGELDCVIEPHEIVDVASRLDGIVDIIEVERGDFVTTGQTLVQLDAGVEAAAVAAARSRATASAEIESNNISTEFALRRRDRLDALYQEAAISGDQMDEITTEANLMGFQLQRARENRRIAELELARSLEILARHTIVSPIDGVVVQRFLSPGESTEDQPILRVAQIDPLRIEVIVPVMAFGSLRIGQQAMVYPEAPKEGAFPATVSIVDRVADAASGTFRVRLSMPNPGYAVPSGLNCRVRFQSGQDGPETTTADVDTSAAKNAQVVPVAQRITADQTALQCRKIGPFADEVDADRIASTLRDHGEVFTKHISRRLVGSGHLVVSAQQGSIHAARTLAADIRATGIEDLFVFGEGPNAGRVALGLYEERSLAELRQRKLLELGFESEMQPHSKMKPEYWLDVELAHEQGATALDSNPLLAGVPVAPVSCETSVAQLD